MNMSTRQAVGISLIAMWSALGARSAMAASASPGEWYPFSERYTKWQSDRPLTFGAWHNCVPSDKIPERIARFRAAGLNAFSWVKPRAGMKYFQAARAQGLEWMTMTRAPEKENWRTLTGAVDDFRNALKIGGCSAIQVIDEPSTRQLPPEQKRAVLNELRDRIDWVHEQFPDLLAYANLSFYKVDLDAYVQRCRPDVFSYDDYPLLRDGGTESNYFTTLNAARAFTIKYRLPFWMILQSFGREPGEGVPYRLPGEADMRFLVFSLLAHGGVGIQFFMYHTDPGWSEAMIQNHLPKGKKPEKGYPFPYEQSYPSPAYHAVQAMAGEVQVLGRALLNLRPSGDIGYAGQVPPKVPAFRPRGKLKDVRFLDKPDAALLVSFFVDQDGQDYFMITNVKHGPNLTQSQAARPVRLTFDTSVKQVERLNRLTGSVEVLEVTPGNDGSRLEWVLPGGTGDLFKWHNGSPWRLRKDGGSVRR